MRHNISSATTQCSSRQAGLAPKISPFWISLVCSEDRRAVSQSIVPIVHILEDLCNFLIKGDRQCAGLCQSPFQAVLMAKHREETILCCGSPPHNPCTYAAVFTVAAAPKTLQKMVHQERLNVVSPGHNCACAQCSRSVSDSRLPPPWPQIQPRCWFFLLARRHVCSPRSRGELCCLLWEWVVSAWADVCSVLLLTPLLISVAPHPWAVLRKATSVLVLPVSKSFADLAHLPVFCRNPFFCPGATVILFTVRSTLHGRKERGRPPLV